ncbi:MAG: hypothetical protein JJE17_11695 [Peptostreptococcaceae bacterium]|nr:hypothetical protein [Peptostreptococcaceae bacterium]
MGWYEALKDSISIAKKAGNIELQGQLLDLQQEMQSMQQENFKLKEEYTKLLAIINRDKNMVYNKNRSAVFENIDGQEHGPYCMHCWEAEKLSISLTPFQNGWYSCPHCKGRVYL